MPNVIDDLDVGDYILTIYVEHEAVVIREGERVVDVFGGVGDDRAVVEFVICLNPTAE